MTCAKYFWATDQDKNALPFSAYFVLQKWVGSQWVTVSTYSIPRGSYRMLTGLLDYPQKYKAIPILDSAYEDDWERPKDEIFTCRLQDISFVYEKIEPPPTTGTLQVRVYDTRTNAYLYNVAVYVDNVYRGVTLGYTGLIIPGVSIGFHTVLLVATGYVNKTVQTYVDADGTVIDTGMTKKTVLIDVRVVDQNSVPVAGSQVTIPNALGATTIATNTSGVAAGFKLTEGAAFTATAAPPTGYTSDSGSTGSGVASSYMTITRTLTKTPITGTLAIGSSPHGARIYIDNVYRGITPPTQYNYITLPVGLYSVKLTLDGYKDATTSARVNAEETTYYSPVLEAETGNVYVTAETYGGTPLIGAEIYVDGVATGILTPGTVTVIAGTHTILAKKDV